MLKANKVLEVKKFSLLESERKIEGDDDMMMMMMMT